MPGLWDLLDSAATGLLNLRCPPKDRGANGPLPSSQEFLLGTARPFGAESPEEGSSVTIPMSALSRHFGIYGASGCGKSTLLRRLRDALISHGINLIAIDYRGDGFDNDLLGLVAAEIPPDRATLIDLRRREYVTPLNFLGYGPGDMHSRAAVVYGALKDLAASWGVQLGQDIRASLIALAEIRGSLLDVSAVLSPDDSSMRNDLLDRVTDDYARQFLESYNGLTPELQRSRSAACLNKLDEFLCDPYLRLAFALSGAPDMKTIMDKKGHVTLCALGADRNPQAGLVGRMMTGAVQRSALARVDIPESSRVPCMLLVDEAQNLLNEDSLEILAEGRRFQLGLGLSTQFAGGLSPALRASAKVNCATQLYFQTSASEASEISGEVVSSLSKDEIKRKLLSAPVGSAITIRRGVPAAFVTTPDSPNPKVDGERVEAFRSAATARTTVSVADARTTSSSRKPCAKPAKEEVVHAKVPTYKRRKA